MKMKLDLRPREARTPPQNESSASFARIVALTLICLLPLMTGAFLVYGFLLSQELALRAQALTLSVEALKKRHADIIEDLAVLKGDVELYRRAVAFIKAEPPVLECLSAVEGALSDATWLSRLEVKSGKATLQGYAPDEGTVMEFARKLLASTVALNVDLPVTRKITKDHIGVVEFSLNCSLKNFNDLHGVSRDALLKK